jgi:hypothetical protein
MRLTGPLDEVHGPHPSAQAPLAALSETDQAAALSVVERSVPACLPRVNDETLAKWAVSLADDLYKSGNFEGAWGPPQWAYVRAVWGTFTLRYVIENTFTDPLQRPLWLHDREGTQPASRRTSPCRSFVNQGMHGNGR